MLKSSCGALLLWASLGGGAGDEAAPLRDSLGATALRMIDLTGDGLLDRLHLTEDGTLSVSINRGGRIFEPAAQILALPRVQVRHVLAADLDGDGYLDLHLTSPGANVTLLGDGTGALVEATDALGLADSGPGESAERLDVDGDGLEDLVIHNRNGDVVFWAEPGGYFTRATPEPAPEPAGAPAVLEKPRPEAPGPGSHAWPGQLERDGQPLDSGSIESEASSQPLPGHEDSSGGQAKQGGPRSGARPPSSDLPAPGGGAALPPSPDRAAPPSAPTSSAGGSGPSIGGVTVGPGGTISQNTTPDERYVNDDMNEVEGFTDIVDETITGADILDGSLTGADVSTSSGDVTFTGGRLGVGTSSPEGILHLSFPADPTIVVESLFGGSLGGAIEFRTGATTDWELGFNQSGSFRIAQRLPFFGLTDIMTFHKHEQVVRIDARLGIGTNSPDRGFELESGQAIARLTTTDDTDGSVLELKSDAATPTALGSIEFLNSAGSAPGRIAYRAAENALTFSTNQAERMRIDSTGRVGIGTSSPLAALHVAGEVLLKDPAGSADNRQVDLTGSYAIYRDDAGTGGDNTRLWIHGPDQGEIILGPRTGAELFGNLRFRSTSHSFEDAPGGNPTLKITGGKVGIGTAAPVRNLEVSAANPIVRVNSTNISNPAILELRNQIVGASSAGAIEFVSAFGTIESRLANSSSSLVFETAGTERLRVDGSGRVGIGTANPTNLLTVVQGSATDPIADAWTTYSSRRWKENIVPLEGGLEKVQKLRGVTFDWKRTGRHDVGMIAEEVGQVIPELVLFEDNGKDARSIDYARLTAVLVEAIKSQQTQIDAQQKQIESLNEQVGQLQQGIAEERSADRSSGSHP